jgi:hypothetical protein
MQRLLLTPHQDLFDGIALRLGEFQVLAQHGDSVVESEALATIRSMVPWSDRG